jgi:hypothetical protein
MEVMHKLNQSLAELPVQALAVLAYGYMKPWMNCSTSLPFSSPGCDTVSKYANHYHGVKIYLGIKSKDKGDNAKLVTKFLLNNWVLEFPSFPFSSLTCNYQVAKRRGF